MLRDHSQPCEHGLPVPHHWRNPKWREDWSRPDILCPGGREVTINYEAAARMFAVMGGEDDRALPQEWPTHWIGSDWEDEYIADMLDAARKIVAAALGVSDDEGNDT